MLLFDNYATRLADRVALCSNILEKPARRLDDDATVERELRLAKSDYSALQAIFRMSISPSEVKTMPHIAEMFTSLGSRLASLEDQFLHSTVSTGRAGLAKPPPPPPVYSSALEAMRTTAETSKDVSKLEAILESGQRSEVAGAAALGLFSQQREQLYGARSNMKQVDTNVKDSQAVLNHISNWWNQFK
eukprot:Protomagalhaensia_wolfi_Nauph_80__53@NODE_1032_length_1789_cov_249_009714_g215_i1_p2_GENE_NODE_1032_length_1789_cov_249_009714_g215_i1NODE_1032_length_1789_cov_249_009714_g215_i1_p2_ORF_typecomplete_len189_score45_94VSNARE_C/PF12352_8/2_4e06FUSC/PF04632_12/0_007Flagellin_N/PF00669_20/0_055_NODE_1032_length_1789_cov_249_009714_g215_i1319885